MLLVEIGTITLPHGVLFRGGAQERIRTKPPVSD
jgi:type I restriction-modification system DNA methylase subunit